MAIFALKTSLFSALVAASMLLHASAQLVPRSVVHRPGFQALEPRADGEPVCKRDLRINNAEYEKRCGPNSDPKHPCFTHWWKNMDDVEACPGKKNPLLDMAAEIYLKDDHKDDFTVRDPHQDFTIKYLGANGARFTYSDYDAATGCYKIKVNIASLGGHWRIWVSDENGDDRDLDTMNKESSSTTLCTKWLRIHVKPDGGGL